MLDQVPNQINQQIEIAQKQLWWKYVIYVGIFFAVCAIGFFLWERFKPVELASHEPVIAQEAKKAVNIKKTTVKAPATLEVYDRSDLLRKVPVPAEIASNPANQFVATGEIPKMPHGGQAVAYLNYTTGKVGISLQANPRPKIGFGGSTNFIAAGGMSTRGNFLVGGIEQPVIRIGPITTGAFGVAGMLGDGGIAAGGIIARW